MQSLSLDMFIVKHVKKCWDHTSVGKCREKLLCNDNNNNNIDININNDTTTTATATATLTAAATATATTGLFRRTANLRMSCLQSGLQFNDPHGLEVNDLQLSSIATYMQSS